MKKEYTINQIVTINDTLTRMANVGLTGRIAYIAYRNLSKTAKIADDYDKTRNELIEKYGEEDPEVAGQIIVKRSSENYPAFIEEITEILSEKEEVDLYKMPEELLDKLADANLSVSDFAVVDNYLVEHSEAEEE